LRAGDLKPYIYTYRHKSVFGEFMCLYVCVCVCVCVCVRVCV
jgi:hypothetical protein